MHASNNYWQRLLHYDGVQSRVISEEFFLSENGKNNPMEEELETIRLLNSDDGFNVACNFPARYEWLVSQFRPVPIFDLHSCKNLQEFLRNFQSEKLSIVFVSEFVDVPASAFGHIMLVFHNANTPLPLADAIHFSAITGSESFLRYSYQGIVGKFDGYYIREALFLKLNEYNIHEQRALHFYELNFSIKEVSRIILHLYELRKARFRYYFITENCAFHIGELLNIALPDEERGFEKQNVVLPIDIVRKHADHIVERRTLVPSLLHAEKLLGNLSDAEQLLIANIIGQQAVSSNMLPNHVKEILALHYQYAFRRQRVVFDNYDEVQSLKYAPSATAAVLKDPLESVESSRAQVGIYRGNIYSGLLLGYRPILGDIYALQQNALQESELSLLDVQTIVHSDGLRLHQLDLIKIRSFPKRNILRKDLSWSAYAGFNRTNENQELRPEVEFGAGASVGSYHFTLNGMTSLGVQGNSGISVYLKPTISLVGYLSGNLKLGIEIAYKHFSNCDYLQNEVFLSRSFGNGYGTLRYIETQSKESQMLASYSFPI